MLRYATLVLTLIFSNIATSDDRPIVFISASMPIKSILQWAEQSKEYDAQLVLRGFVDNDFGKTIAFIKRLNELVDGIRLSIDPESFSENKVNKVPAVLYKGQLVYGDIGLKESIKLVRRYHVSTEK